MLAKIGPAMNVNRRRPVSGSSWRMSVPVMSEGIMSGVNWMRRNERLEIRATVLTSSVLASPGTPTSKHVAAGEQADEQLLDDVVLADDRPCRSRRGAAGKPRRKLLRGRHVVAGSLRCFCRRHADSSFLRGGSRGKFPAVTRPLRLSSPQRLHAPPGVPSPNGQSGIE